MFSLGAQHLFIEAPSEQMQQDAERFQQVCHLFNEFSSGTSVAFGVDVGDGASSNV